MASKLAVCTAAFLHLILGFSMYLTQGPDACSPAPQLASYIFAGAILIISYHIPFFAERYTHLPYWVQYLVETMGTLGILEFSDMVVWCCIELFIRHVVHMTFMALGMGSRAYLEQEYWLLGAPTLALATSFLFLVNRIVQYEEEGDFRRHVNMQLNREMYMLPGYQDRNNRNRPRNRRNF